MAPKRKAEPLAEPAASAAPPQQPQPQQQPHAASEHHKPDALGAIARRFGNVGRKIEHENVLLTCMITSCNTTTVKFATGEQTKTIFRVIVLKAVGTPLRNYPGDPTPYAPLLVETPESAIARATDKNRKKEYDMNAPNEIPLAPLTPLSMSGMGAYTPIVKSVSEGNCVFALITATFLYMPPAVVEKQGVVVEYHGNYICNVRNVTQIGVVQNGTAMHNLLKTLPPSVQHIDLHNPHAAVPLRITGVVNADNADHLEEPGMPLHGLRDKPAGTTVVLLAKAEKVDPASFVRTKLNSTEEFPRVGFELLISTADGKGGLAQAMGDMVGGTQVAAQLGCGNVAENKIFMPQHMEDIWRHMSVVVQVKRDNSKYAGNIAAEDDAGAGAGADAGADAHDAENSIPTVGFIVVLAAVDLRAYVREKGIQVTPEWVLEEIALNATIDSHDVPNEKPGDSCIDLKYGPARNLRGMGVDPASFSKGHEYFVFVSTPSSVPNATQTARKKDVDAYNEWKGMSITERGEFLSGLKGVTFQVFRTDPPSRNPPDAPADLVELVSAAARKRVFSAEHVGVVAKGDVPFLRIAQSHATLAIEGEKKLLLTNGDAHVDKKHKKDVGVNGANGVEAAAKKTRADDVRKGDSVDDEGGAATSENGAGDSGHESAADEHSAGLDNGEDVDMPSGDE